MPRVKPESVTGIRARMQEPGAKSRNQVRRQELGTRYGNRSRNQERRQELGLTGSGQQQS